MSFPFGPKYVYLMECHECIAGVLCSCDKSQTGLFMKVDFIK